MATKAVLSILSITVSVFALQAIPHAWKLEHTDFIAYVAITQVMLWHFLLQLLHRYIHRHTEVYSLLGRRSSARYKDENKTPVRIILADNREFRDMAARVLDFSDVGLGLESELPLQLHPGDTVILRLATSSTAIRSWRKPPVLALLQKSSGSFRVTYCDREHHLLGLARL